MDIPFVGFRAISIEKSRHNFSVVLAKTSFYLIRINIARATSEGPAVYPRTEMDRRFITTRGWLSSYPILGSSNRLHAFCAGFLAPIDTISAFRHLQRYLQACFTRCPSGKLKLRRTLLAHNINDDIFFSCVILTISPWDDGLMLLHPAHHGNAGVGRVR